MFIGPSISKKLTRMNMLVSGAALLLACAAFIAYDVVTFRQDTLYNLSVQTQIAGSNAVSALLFNDPVSAENTLSSLKASPDILYAGILTSDGHSFAAYSRGRGAQAPALPAIPAGQDAANRFANGNILLVRSIVFQGKRAGTIYILSDSEMLNARLRRYIGISGVVLAVSLLLALLVSSIFSRAVAKPIVGLAEVARTVSRYRDYSIRAAPAAGGGEISVLIHAFNDMLAQMQEHDRALRKAHDELEQRVLERTNELATINTELESFSYSVSHDLRAPLRGIDGFSQALLEDYGDKLDARGQDYLQRVRRGTQQMAVLIDDMLNLSRVTRAAVRREPLDLSAVAKSIATELKEAEPGRQVEFVIENNLTATGDSRLVRAAMDNLLRNAWKYTSAHPRARIEFGKSHENGKSTFFVRDDGAGFDPRYAERLFGVFQRLHNAAEFPGTGIGLATVHRIIRKHGGSIWAEGEVEKGATFYFTLQ